MAIHFYILPIERTADGTQRGPKYFRWRYDPDPPGIVCPWSMMDYGNIDEGIVCADVTTAQNTSLASHADVYVVPANIDSNMNGGAVSTAKTFMENYNIPAGWINAGTSYRSILRTVTGFFLFMQRVTALLGHTLTLPAGWLNLQVRDIPADVQAAMTQAATELGYDYSTVTGTTTMRAILKAMADGWGSQAVHFGLADL